MSKLWGIFGKPYLDLEPYVDRALLDELDDEICAGLVEVDVGYTGGSLKWMGVAAPWVYDDPYEDLGWVIERMTREERLKLVSLADDPSAFDPSRVMEYRFGDETDHPLSWRQTRWLELKFGVYFPWKVVYHLLENVRWEDNQSGRGKAWDPDALRYFPKTVAFIKSLPFTEIGRCLIFGLLANDHATVHRDSEPGSSVSVAQCINISPRADKRFFLVDPDGEQQTFVDSRVYWFNDMDFHGVEADPWFRYSIRVDGMLDPAFVKQLSRAARARTEQA
jgi:Rieske 2Fe-2S family protein